MPTILTLNAYPAKRDGAFTTVAITSRIACDQAPVATLADCHSAFEDFIAKNLSLIGPTRELDMDGVQFSAYIRDGHGRKPNGYKGAKFTRYFAAAKAPAVTAVEVAA